MQYWLICCRNHPSATLGPIYEGLGRDHKYALANLQNSLGSCSKIGCLLLVGSCKGWKETVHRECQEVKTEVVDLHSKDMLLVRHEAGISEAGVRLHVDKPNTEWRCQTQSLLNLMPRMHKTANIRVCQSSMQDMANSRADADCKRAAREGPASLHACGIAASNAAASGLPRARSRALVDCSTVFV